MSNCRSGFDGGQSGWITPGGGGGGVSEVTSPDGSLTIVDGTGPTVQASLNTTAAVDAVLAFREYGSDVYNTPLVVATPTPQLYRAATTPNLAGGVYAVSLAIRVVGSNGGTDINADVRIDGVSLGSILTEAVVPGGGFLLSGTTPQVWAPGVHTVEYFVSQPGGPGFVTTTLAITTWVREQ